MQCDGIAEANVNSRIVGTFTTWHMASTALRMQSTNEWRRPFKWVSHGCNAEVDQCMSSNSLVMLRVATPYENFNEINDSFFMLDLFLCAHSQFANDTFAAMCRKDNLLRRMIFVV